VATITSLAFNIHSDWDGSGVRAAREDLDRLRADMRQMSGAALHIDVVADTDRARAEMQQFKEEQDDIHMNVHLDVAQAKADMERLKATAGDIGISFNINETSYAETEARIDFLTRDRTINIDIDRERVGSALNDITDKLSQTGNHAVLAGEQAQHMSRMMVLASAVAVAAIALLPAAISMVGAALMTLPGIATLALGGLFLSQIQEVKDAFTSLKDTVMDVGKRAAEPMKAPLIAAMKEIRQWVIDNEGLFREMYTGAAKLIEPLTNSLKGFMDKMLPGVNAALQASVPFFERFGEGFVNLGDRIGNMFQIMSTKAESFGETWKLVFTFLGDIMQVFGEGATSMVDSANTSMGETMQSLMGFFRGLLDGLKGFIDAVAQAKGGLDIWKMLGDILAGILPALGELYAAFSTALGPALKELLPHVIAFASEFIVSLVPIIRESAPILLAVAQAFGKILDWLTPMMPVLGPVAVGLWGISAAVSAITAAMAANPIGLIVIALAALVVGIIAIEEKTHFFSNTWHSVWDKIGEPLTNFWNSAKDIFNKLWEFLGPKFTEIWNTLRDTVMDAWNQISPALTELKNSLQPLWDAAKPILAALGAAVYAAFTFMSSIILNTVINVIKPIINGLVELIRNVIQILTGIFQFLTGAFETVKGVAEIFINFIKMVFYMVTGQSDKATASLQAVKNGFMDFFQGIVKMLQGLATIIDGIWDTIYNLFKTAIGTLIGFIRGWVIGIIDWFKHMWDVLVGHSIVPDMINAIVDWFLSLPKKIFGMIRDFVMGIINFFIDLATKVIDAVRNLWNNVITSLTTFVQMFKDAWSAVWNWVRDFAVGLWNWVKDRWNDFVEGVKQILNLWVEGIRIIWDTFWSWIRDFAVGLWNWVKDRWNDFVEGVKAILNLWVEAFKLIWGNFWGAIRDTAQAIWDFIKQKWDDFCNGVRIIVENIRDRIVDIWNRFWNGIKETAVTIWEGIKTEFDNFKNNVVGTIEGLVNKVKEVWDRITGIFKEPVDAVKGIWNGVAGAFGLPQLAVGGEVQHKATGGSVLGAGTGTSDDIPAMLSNGEHVWTAAEVNAAGGQAAVYKMRQDVLRGGRQNVGIGNVMNDNAFAGGGEVRPASLDPTIAMAREKGDGRAYVYGGSGPEGFDCSGYMSAIFNSLTGRPLWGRSFSTESDFNALGFADGLGAGFSVGIMRGGGGPNSHMAGTLDGTNVESGGAHNSTRYGGPAAGADHSQFPIKKFLPIMGGQFVSGGMGSGGGGPSPEQIRKHDEAVAAIRAKIDETNKTSASRTRAIEVAQQPGQAKWIEGALRNAYGIFEPAGDVHAAGTQKSGEGAIGKLDAALAAANSIGGTIPEGERLKIIEDAMRATNTPPPSTREAWLAGMNTLITRESGWNAGARNDTDSNAAMGQNSVGLAQVIPSTFEANKAPGLNNIYGAVDNVAASINYIKRRYGSIENVQQANANMPPQGYALGTQSAAAGWNLVGENGPEMVKFRGGESVTRFNEIITELKKSSAIEGKSLETKLSTDMREFADKIVAAHKDGSTDLREAIKTEMKNLIDQMSKDAQQTGMRLQVSIEDALERLASLAGIKIDISAAGGNADALIQQVLPQLEMALRQRVGAQG
jgi:SLT domain-containing protein/phage-related protein